MKEPAYTFGYSNLTDWESIPDSEADIVANLPHGSGIDASWVIEFNTAGKVVAYSSYHIMDEHGYYRRWIDFSVRWEPGQFADFRLMFHNTDSTDRYWIERQDLRDYLETSIYEYVTYQVTAARYLPLSDPSL